MLSSEFSQEMGALIRRLETKVRMEPELKDADDRRRLSMEDPLDHLERAIVTLAALHIELQRANKRAPE